MEKTNRSIVYVIISVTILSTIFITIMSRKQLNSEYIKCIRQSSILKNKVKSLTNNFNVLDRIWFSKIEDIQLVTMEGDILPITDILHEKQLVYYYDSRKACKSCVDEMILLLRKMAVENDCTKIILITNVERNRDLKILVSKYNIPYSCYSTKETLITLKGYVNQPFTQLVFVLGNDLKISFPTIVNTDTKLSEYQICRYTELIR